jgi:hypothetical protein
VWQTRADASPSPTPVKIAARHTLILFGALMCEKDSPQIVKTLAGDRAVSQRSNVCESAGFKRCRSWDGGVGEIGYLIRIADHKINRLDELEALLPCF